MKFKTIWVRGDKALIAAAVGISPQYLSDILANRARCSAVRAIALEKAARHLGYRTPRLAWVFVDLRAGNPLFPEI